MKNVFLVIVVFFISLVSYAQMNKEMKLNKETNLVEAIYFHENGSISQKGTFNLERKLHGEWVSYNKEGKTVAIGSYINGVKTGKWLFWANDILKEVEYADNTIAGVTETKNTQGIVNRN